MQNRQKNLLILTEGGSTIGFGHLTRCSSLEREFVAAGWNVEGLAFTDHSEIELPDGFRPYDWHERLGKLKVLSCADMVIVDSYIISDSAVKTVLENARHPVFIDDLIRRQYDSGCVVDWTIGAERYAFLPRKEGVNYFLGAEYCCVRKEFCVPAQRRSSLESVLITFGGSDIRSLTRPVLRTLCQSWPGLIKRVIIGPGAQDTIYPQEDWPNCHFYFNCSAAEMRYVMDASSVAVCTGGQTLYEMAARGLPPLAIGILDNQMDDINGFASAGFLTYVGMWSDPELLSNIQSALSTMKDPRVVAQRSARGTELVDGLGVTRLMAALAESSNSHGAGNNKRLDTWN